MGSVGVEMTLGATSRDLNEEEQRLNSNSRITPTYLQNRTVFSPTRNSGGGHGHGNTSTKSNQSNNNKPVAYGGYGHAYNKKVVQQQQGGFSTSNGSDASSSTLGARPMEKRMQAVRDRDNNYSNNDNGNDNDNSVRTTVSTI